MSTFPSKTGRVAFSVVMFFYRYYKWYMGKPLRSVGLLLLYTLLAGWLMSDISKSSAFGSALRPVVLVVGMFFLIPLQFFIACSLFSKTYKLLGWFEQKIVMAEARSLLTPKQNAQLSSLLKGLGRTFNYRICDNPSGEPHSVKWSGGAIFAEKHTRPYNSYSIHLADGKFLVVSCHRAEVLDAEFLLRS